MPRNGLDVVPVGKLHHILRAVLLSLFVDVLLAILDFVPQLVYALDAIYGECVLLGPYAHSDDLDIRSLAYYIPVCKLTAFFCSLALFVKLYVRLVSNGLDWR